MHCRILNGLFEVLKVLLVKALRVWNYFGVLGLIEVWNYFGVLGLAGNLR